jgi:hypothetical protein
MRIHRIVLAAILVGPIAGLLIACEGGGVRGDLPRIDTIPEISELRAGESVAIACEVRNGSGDLVDVPTTVAVEPEYGLTLQKKVATFTVTGTFRARCAAPSMGLTDDTPAQILVTPADPATSEAILDPDTVPAGTPSQVSCLVRDAFGNLIPDALTTVEGDDGLTINGALVSATLVGSYDVTCAVDGFDVTRTGDVLKVEPADPDRIVLTVAPSRAFYAVENTVKLTYKIYDAYDNRVPSARADLTYEPKANVRDLGGGEIRFLQEGHTLATATVRPPFDHVSDSIMLACDQSAPVLDVLFPPRGHTQDGDPVLVVRGTVTDLAGSDITEITVNGEAATLHSDGRFEYPIQSMHGMNGLRISASDEHGFSTFTTRGYYYSTGWLDVPGNANLDDMIVSQAALLFLGQQALDDGDHDPARLNDMATIVEALLGLDFLDLLGGLPPFGVTIPNIINLTLLGFGIQGDLEVQVGFRDIVFGAPRVDLDSRDGGIDAGIGFRPVSIGIDLSFIIHARATGFGQSIPLLDPSTTTASSLTVGHLALAVSLDIDKPFGGELFVEGRDFDVILDEVSIDPIAGLWIDLGPIPGTGINLGSYDLSQLVGGLNNLLRDWVLNPLVNFVTPLLVDLLEPVVVPLLGDAVRQVLDLLSIRQAFELPALLGGSATSLELALDLSSITFTDDGGLVGLDLGFLAEDQVNMRTLGAIRRDGCMGTDPDPTVFDLGTEPSIQAGVHGLAFRDAEPGPRPWGTAWRWRRNSRRESCDYPEILSAPDP